ncbi:MAG TPA: hypothetical protein VFW87_03280 [Pirellulales bacterium]|nr:hypothetical protein [Pirellulales bacterium]
MARPTVRTALLLLAALPALAMSGCTWPLNTQFSSPTWHFPVPIPLSPYFQKSQEDKFWMRERYQRVPILGPVTSGGPPVALDPPSPDEVVRALERARNVQGGVPLLHEIQRNNVRMVVEPLADYVDPPRVYPLIGPAQLHHAHYKCIIYFTEVTRVGWPIPYTTVDEDAQEVIYIDHNHFHLVGNVDDGPGGNL